MRWYSATYKSETVSIETLKRIIDKKRNIPSNKLCIPFMWRENNTFWGIIAHPISVGRKSLGAELSQRALNP
jgi:hypothetical protein